MNAQQPKLGLLEVLTAPLASAGLDIEDIEVSKAGRRRLVRVLVDKQGGVTLDDIAAATTTVSTLLDDLDVMGESGYTLEVTSPGVDRPLTLPRHWQRNTGRLVRVTPTEGAAFTGRISEVSDAAATLDVDGSAREVPFNDIAKARIEIEFNRPRASAGLPHQE
jgi:ribosome maturation factor RimP